MATGPRYITSGGLHENTASTVLPLLRVQLSLRLCDDYRPFPSYGNLCRVHNSFFEQLCHNIIHDTSIWQGAVKETLRRECQGWHPFVIVSSAFISIRSFCLANHFQRRGSGNWVMSIYETTLSCKDNILLWNSFYRSRDGIPVVWKKQ
jgi:hypothetical protein